MLAGGIVWHLLRTLRRAVGRLLLWFLVTGLIAAVLVELAAIMLSNGQLPGLLTNITALAVGLAVGYSVSFTLLIFEIIRDLFTTVEDIGRDIRNEFVAGGKLAGTIAQTFEPTQRRQ
jgi:hypothetical protein